MPHDLRPSRRWFRWSLRTMFVVVTVSFLVGVPLAVYFGLVSTGEIVRDCYAAQWVARSIVEHMKTHDGAWPKNWDDLRPSYKSLTDRAGEEVWSTDELRSRVEVDWNADPQQLLKTTHTGSGPPFKAIWLSDGRSVHWQGEEPNQLILEYLQANGGPANPR